MKITYSYSNAAKADSYRFNDFFVAEDWPVVLAQGPQPDVVNFLVAELFQSQDGVAISRVIVMLAQLVPRSRVQRRSDERLQPKSLTHGCGGEVLSVA